MLRRPKAAEPEQARERVRRSLSPWARRVLDAPVAEPGAPSEREAEQQAQGHGSTASRPGRDHPPLGGPLPPWGEGRPLVDDERARLGARLGAAPLGVRVHEGPEAARWAAALGARAFTVGDDIVLGAGAYVPGTTAGDALLAHEATHVAQQRATGMPMVARVALSPADLSALADQIHAATDRWGTDEEAVFVALQTLERDPTAIAALRREYQARHHADLEAVVRDEMSGTELDFALELLGIAPAGGAAIGAAPSTTADFEALARRLHAATEGQLGTDEEGVYAALVPLGRDPGRAQQLKTAYQRLFNRSLEDVLEDEMSGDELSYALFLLNAPGPATTARTPGTTVSGPGTPPSAPVPAVEGGVVEVGTGVPWTSSSGRSSQFAFGVGYRGGLAEESRWVQFLWREVIATGPTGTTRLSGPIAMGGNTYDLTDDPRSPNYVIDVPARATTPFYEEWQGTATRAPGITTVYDAPDPATRVPEAFAAGATSVVSVAHFDVFLVRAYRTLYHVGIDVTDTFSGPGTRTGRTRTVRVTRTVSSMPEDMRSALVRRFPSFSYIQ
ncbi:MAG TPA: DUF4157 domain-containing protein [Acidimicrobiales bacterium]|nr:DUF4157 domain-containing protein [Acidimicrobiales bacterium]